MAGVQFKTNAPAPAAPVVAETPVETAGTATSVNDGTAITLPTVAAPAVPANLDRIDDGDEADYEILHHRVGEFTQGDKVKADRFQEGTDFKRLLKLEAVKALKDAAPAPDDKKKAK